MDKRKLKDEWNGRVEIIESTFDKYHLELQGYGFSDILRGMAAYGLR